MIDKNNNTTTDVLIISGIPTEVKRQFKVYCAEQNVSMSELLVQVISLIVEHKDELPQILKR